MAVARRRHLQRYTEIAGILVDEGFDALLDQLGLSRFVPLRRRLSRRHPRPRASLPERVRIVLERLGPTFVKIGQLLSTRPDLIPPEYVDELRKLQDEVPAVPYDAIASQVCLGLGADVKELFATFDPTPLAAASIGQVHAASLHDGTAVVVKVQRPGIRRLIDVDLDILRTQAQFAERYTAWGSRYELVEVAEEIARILRLELDYVAEARNAEKFASEFADEEAVLAARPYWEHTSRTVLTMERIEGIKLDRREELIVAGYDPPEIARLGVQAYLRQIFVHGFFHADPHPGNLFVVEGGRIGFSDFGRVGTVTERMKDQFADMLIALVNRDEAETVDVLLEIGVAAGDVDERGLEREVSRLFAQYYEAAMHRMQVSGVVEHLLHLVWRYRLRVPSEFTLLLTTFSTLEGVARQLDPEFNIIEAARPFASEILRARLHARVALRTAWRGVRRYNRLLLALPEMIDRLMRRLADGSFAIEVKPRGFGPLMVQVRELVNRLAFAIVIGSFVVGFSLLLRGQDLPRWLILGSELALFGAAGIGVWFFVDIFLSMWRSRSWRQRG